MTVQEYQDRNVAITNEINDLRVKADSYTAQAAQYRATAQAWLNQIGNKGKTTCTGTKKQKDACEADATEKRIHAQNNINLALSSEANAKDIQEKKIPALQLEFNENIQRIEETQATEAQVAEELSKQGKTIESVQTIAEAQAQAEIETQRVVSQARAAGELQKMEADASNKRKYGYVIAGVGALVLIIVAIALIKKFRKKK